MSASVVLSGCSGPTKSAEDGAVLVPLETKAEMLEPLVSTGAPARKKVVVLPFRNFTENISAAEIVTDAYVAQLFADGRYVVEEPGNVRHFIIQEQVSVVGEMEFEKLALLGRRMNADAVIVGNVEVFETGLVYGSPVVSVYARMVDTSSGRVVWAGQSLRRGDDYTIIFEFGKVRTPTVLASRVVSELIETMQW